VARKRKGLSLGLRFEIFKRDGFACQYCGQTPPAAILEVDHILAVSKGGSDEIENLLTSCFDCNRGKAARDLKKIPESLSQNIEVQKEKMLQIEEYNKFLMQKRKMQDGVIDELGRYWFNQFKREKDKFVFGSARLPSIKTFLKHLAPVEIMDAMDIAFGRIKAYDYDEKTWKYFCGVCWKMIKERRGDDE
jgi:hypothetical protein